MTQRPNLPMEGGFVLLDAVVTILILALFFYAATGFYSGAVKTVRTREVAVATYLEGYRTRMDEWRVFFGEED